MSYAIISLGGKQFRVQEGQRLLVDRLSTDEGKTFTPELLLLGGQLRIVHQSYVPVRGLAKAIWNALIAACG